MTRFTDKHQAQNAAGKYVCVGLDPDIDQIPDCVTGDTPTERILNFLCPIVEATSPWAADYKPQSAYYEAPGPKGMEVLDTTTSWIRHCAPDAPVILDFKRGDIDRTSEAYAQAADYYDVEAVTVNPYMGGGAIEPLLSRGDRTHFVLCRTSNPDAGEFQDAVVTVYLDEKTGYYYSTSEWAEKQGATVKQVAQMPLYQFIAHRAGKSWQKKFGNCGVVVGATATEELAAVRSIVGDIPILIPGLGKQKGNQKLALLHGRDSKGGGFVLNNSSDLLYAYKRLTDDAGNPLFAPEQFAEASGEAARRMNEAVVSDLAALAA